MSDPASQSASRSPGSPVDDASVDGWAERITRYGWIAKGLVFVLIGVLAVQLATQGYGRDADKGGALAEVADTAPAGRWSVGAVGIGLLLFAAWQLWSAVRSEGTEPLQLAKRVGWFGLAAAYSLFGVTALQIAVSGGGGEAGDQQGPTSPTGLSERLFELPGGRIVVAGIGMGTMVVGLYHLVKGVRLDFFDDIETDDLSRHSRRALAALGLAGFVARATLLGIAGSLFVVASWQYDPDEAAGIDESLRTVASAPYGRILLVLCAVGIMAAGVYDAVTYRRRRLAEQAA